MDLFHSECSSWNSVAILLIAAFAKHFATVLVIWHCDCTYIHRKKYEVQVWAWWHKVHSEISFTYMYIYIYIWNCVCNACQISRMGATLIRNNRTGTVWERIYFIWSLSLRVYIYIYIYIIIVKLYTDVCNSLRCVRVSVCVVAHVWVWMSEGGGGAEGSKGWQWVWSPCFISPFYMSHPSW